MHFHLLVRFQIQNIMNKKAKGIVILVWPTQSWFPLTSIPTIIWSAMDYQAITSCPMLTLRLITHKMRQLRLLVHSTIDSPPDGLSFIRYTFTQHKIQLDITNILIASWRQETKKHYLQNLSGKMVGILICCERKIHHSQGKLFSFSCVYIN